MKIKKKYRSLFEEFNNRKIKSSKKKYIKNSHIRNKLGIILLYFLTIIFAIAFLASFKKDIKKNKSTITKTVNCNINNKIAVQSALKECKQYKNSSKKINCKIKTYRTYCTIIFVDDDYKYEQFYRYKIIYSNINGNTSDTIKNNKKDKSSLPELYHNPSSPTNHHSNQYYYNW